MPFLPQPHRSRRCPAGPGGCRHHRRTRHQRRHRGLV